MTEFARRLTLLDVFCLGVNSIIGSGIFLFPGKLAKTAGPSSVFAFLICGLLLVTIALCYAEMAGICKRNGGAYVYAREAFGPQLGFVVGWIALLTSIFSCATVASALSSYLGYFNPIFEDPNVSKAIACSLIAIFTVINYLGVKLGAYTVNFFTLAKTLPLLLFVLVGIFHIKGANYQPLLDISPQVMSSAIFLSLWPLQGFESTPIMAGETKNPNRDIPLATIASLLGVMVFYTLIQLVAVGTMPGLAASKKPLAEAAALFLGPIGASIIALGAFISMTGYLSGNTMGCPRYLEALSEDGFLPMSLSAAHPRYQTPHRSIVLISSVAILMIISLDFSRLVDISTMAVISQYLATCLAVIWLRLKEPERKRSFKIPGGISVPIVGCLISLWLVQNVKVPEMIFTLECIALGVVLAFAYHLYRRQQPAAG